MTDQSSLCAVREHGGPRNGGDHGERGSSSAVQGHHATWSPRRWTKFVSSCRRQCHADGSGTITES